MEEVASLKEVLWQMGASSRTPFRFTWTSRFTSGWSLSPECKWDCSTTPEDQTCYCIQVRVPLGDGGNNQPSPSHVWSGSVIADILQEAWLRNWITEAVVLSLEEDILFFERCSQNEDLLYQKAKDIEFSLGGPFNLARKLAQIGASVKTMQKRKLKPGGQDAPGERWSQPGILL